MKSTTRVFREVVCVRGHVGTVDGCLSSVRRVGHLMRQASSFRRLNRTKTTMS